MKVRFKWLLLLLMLPLLGGAVNQPKATVTNIVTQIVDDFSLLNVDGESISLSQYPNAKGFMVVFTCNHCPFAKLYPERLNKISKKYEPLNVPLLAISSTDTIQYEEDTYSNMVKVAKEKRMSYPYLFDGTQAVAKKFHAERTPHAFIIWKIGNDWVVKYNGAIDDNGAEPNKVKNHYLTNAVDALLANKPVTDTLTKSIGCVLHYRK